MDAFERYARAGLELAEVPIDDVDLKVMRAAHAVHGVRIRALLEADLTDAMPEVDLDPSRAPRTL